MRQPLAHDLPARPPPPYFLPQAEIEELRGALEEREGQLLGQVESEAALQRQVRAASGAGPAAGLPCLMLCRLQSPSGHRCATLSPPSTPRGFRNPTEPSHAPGQVHTHPLIASLPP
jgi:hypothetical protein